LLNNQVRILNFDNSVTRQNDFIARFHPAIIELQKIAPAARLWLNKTTEKEIKSALAPELKNAVTFLGSGDFHHITSLLIEQFTEPVSVIVFDHHPDWDTLPPKTGCGSWVSRILKKPNVQQVILFGISSGDISTFNIQTGNLAALKDSRLEIYPYAHVATRVFLRQVPENRSLGLKKKIFHSNIYWQELQSKQDLAKFSRQSVANLETKQVYVSIDKDCLKSEYALTNWEEGFLELEELLTILKVIKEDTDIVGLDITGDYSEINIKSKIKSFCSRLDHPKNFSAKDKSPALIDSINAQTNIRMLELLKP
jgi:arginase family enzyme